MNYMTLNDTNGYPSYSIPKCIIYNENYKTVSAESKLLYGVLIDKIIPDNKNDFIFFQWMIYVKK